MKRELTAQLGADGVLTLTVPLNRDNANKTVHVVVETIEPSSIAITDPEEWRRFVSRTAGRWLGDFVREPEGEYEQRDPL